MKKLLFCLSNISKTNTKIDLKAIFSFSVFAIILLKYQLINIHQIIPSHSIIHGIITYLFIVPLALAGIFFSLKIFILSFKNLSKNIYNMVLVLPLLILVVYYFFFFN